MFSFVIYYVNVQKEPNKLRRHWLSHSGVFPALVAYFVLKMYHGKVGKNNSYS